MDGSDLMLQPAYIEFNFPVLIVREDAELGIYFWLIIAAAFRDLGITLFFYLKIKPYSMWLRITMDYLRVFFLLNAGQVSFKSEPMVPCFNNIALSMEARMAYILKHSKNLECVAEKAKI